MSYALETSKRKFHRILDTISNASSTSLVATREQDASMGELDLQPPRSKRVRLSGVSLAVGAPPTNLSSQPGDASTLQIIAKARLATSKTTSKMYRTSYTTCFGDVVSPCVYSSRSDFLSRLKTFSRVSGSHWSEKPDAINEVAFAKRGWVCDGPEVVRCTCCNRSICVTWIDPNDSLLLDDSIPYDEEVRQRGKFVEEAVTKFAQNIVGWHDEGCLWRRRGCDAQIYRVPVLAQKEALVELRARRASLFNIRDDLPVVFVPGGVDHQLMADDLERWVFPTEGPGPDENEYQFDQRYRMLGLALFGWAACDGATTYGPEGAIYCGACFARVAFWNYAMSDAEVGEARPRLNVTDIHRHYCPWVNEHTQNDGASASGYSEESGSASTMLIARILRVIDFQRTLATLERGNQTLQTGIHDAYVDALASTNRRFSLGPASLGPGGSLLRDTTGEAPAPAHRQTSRIESLDASAQNEGNNKSNEALIDQANEQPNEAARAKTNKQTNPATHDSVEQSNVATRDEADKKLLGRWQTIKRKMGLGSKLGAAKSGNFKPGDINPGHPMASGINAGGTNAGGTNAGGTYADGTNASGANASGANAIGTNADRTNASGANAIGTNADGTNASGANASGANAGKRRISRLFGNQPEGEQ